MLQFHYNRWLETFFMGNYILLLTLESMTKKWGWSQILTPIDEDYHINKLKHAFDSIQIGKSIITEA